MKNTLSLLLLLTTIPFLMAARSWTVSPGGSDTYCQFNDSGAFGGDAGCTYNKTTNKLSVGSVETAPVASPTWKFDDSDDPTAGEVDGQIVFNCPTTNDCDMSWQINSGSSDLTTIMKIDTTDAGASTLQIGDPDGTDYTSIDEAGAITVVAGSALAIALELADPEIAVAVSLGLNSINSTQGVILASSHDECRMLEVVDITCDDGNGCTAATVDGDTASFPVANFATGADDLGAWTFELPVNLSSDTDASVTFVWMSDNAECDNNGSNTDTVCWTVDSDSFANDGDFDGGVLGGTEVGISDTCIAQGDIMYTTAVTLTHGFTIGSTPSRAMVVVRRDTDETIGSCSDEYLQDASLLAVRLCYKVNNLLSGEYAP